jgi:hypothetical protein
MAGRDSCRDLRPHSCYRVLLVDGELTSGVLPRSHHPNHRRVLALRQLNLRQEAIWFPSKDFLAACLSLPSFRLLLRGWDLLRASAEGASSDLCDLTFSSASSA